MLTRRSVIKFFFSANRRKHRSSGRPTWRTCIKEAEDRGVWSSITLYLYFIFEVNTKFYWWIAHGAGDRNVSMSFHSKVRHLVASCDILREGYFDIARRIKQVPELVDNYKKIKAQLWLGVFSQVRRIQRALCYWGHLCRYRWRTLFRLLQYPTGHSAWRCCNTSRNTVFVVSSRLQQKLI